MELFQENLQENVVAERGISSGKAVCGVSWEV